MLFAGVKHLTDFQDPAYAGEYLDRVAKLYELDRAHGGAAKAYAFTAAAAKYVAVAMTYDDVIRVADLKTRASRYERVMRENSVGEGQIVYTTEYMHPRLEEVAGTMPAPLGRFHGIAPDLVRLGVPQRPARALGNDPLVPDAVRAGGVQADPPHDAAPSSARWRTWKSGLPSRPAHIAQNYDVAVEVLNARRLVKGYSDTHARGESKFDRVIGAVPLLRRAPTAPIGCGGCATRPCSTRTASRSTARSRPSRRCKSSAGGSLVAAARARGV